MYICAACVRTVRGNFGQSDSPRRRVQFSDTQLRPVLCLPAVGWCGDKFGPNFDNFFLGFFVVARAPMMPWMCPVCWFARGRSRSAHKKLKRVKKELKTGQKRTQNGPKKNENLIFWKLIFWVLHVRNDKIRCLTERISLIRRRWCAMREQVLVFLGTPPQLEYSVTKLVTLSH